MKKNKAMRLASVLLVLTLLTTCMTAGTFAKYTTEAAGTETAKVAKFGVKVSVDAGNVFGKKYKNDKGGNGVVTEGDDITVNASEMVVAPGTKGEMTFSITGTPETKVKLEIVMSDIKEIGLAEGTYTYSDVTPERSVSVGKEGYDPVKWTLKKNDSSVSNYEDTSLVEIGKYLGETGLTKEYTPKEFNNVTDTYTLSWEWPYESNNDDKDTLLGDLAANVYTIKKDSQAFTDTKLNEGFKLKISVTQVD